MLQIIQSQISKPSFDTWFKHTEAQFDGESLRIYANPFTIAWVENRYSTLIKNALHQVTGEPSIKVVFQSTKPND
jgi:chromosomal replication initiator protein